MENISIFHTIIAIAFFAAFAAIFIPDKMSSKWISMLCIVYMLLNIITSIKNFSFYIRNDVTKIVDDVEKTTAIVSESADNLIEEELEKNVNEYIYEKYGIYTSVECDISNGCIVSLKYEKNIQSNIISDVNEKFLRK